MHLSGPKVVMALTGHALYSDRAQQLFTVYVGVLYVLQIGRRGNFQALPLGYSCRWRPVAGSDRLIRWGR